jgi:hypothetical protein
MNNFKFLSKLSQRLNSTVLLSLIPAIFWVIFLWNFWDKGVYALGFNSTIFAYLLLALFVWVLYRKKHYRRYDLNWLIPLSLLILSYSLYDNPFLKISSLLLIPIIWVLFYNQAFLVDKDKRFWNFSFLNQIVIRFFSVFSEMPDALRSFLKMCSPKTTNKNVAWRIIFGLLLFIIIAFTIFIPLLSSADAMFAAKLHVIYEAMINVFASVFIYKLLMMILLAVVFLAALRSWSSSFDYREEKNLNKKIDPIVSGIVLTGILGLYLLFLGIQMSRLWIGSLPFDFQTTETLVKSGFWQLLLLSIINILIYLTTYRKTSSWVQKILIAFTFASLLLLASAAYRMALYVTYYGFSYEKFFASYTVIYAVILFIWLIIKLFATQRANVLKFVIMLFLWMYALISILPVEQFILRTNLALSRMPDSRIRLFELSMLSPDVLMLVQKYQKQGLLTESVAYLDREGERKNGEVFEWQPWITKQEQIVLEKKWYEKNITNLLYLINHNY